MSCKTLFSYNAIYFLPILGNLSTSSPLLMEVLVINVYGQQMPFLVSIGIKGTHDIVSKFMFVQTNQDLGCLKAAKFH